jgi:hypothetical protein
MRNKKKSLRFKGTQTRPMMGKGLSPIEFENGKRPRLNVTGCVVTQFPAVSI